VGGEGGPVYKSSWAVTNTSGLSQSYVEIVTTNGVILSSNRFTLDPGRYWQKAGTTDVALAYQIISLASPTADYAPETVVNGTSQSGVGTSTGITSGSYGAQDPISLLGGEYTPSSTNAFVADRQNAAAIVAATAQGNAAQVQLMLQQAAYLGSISNSLQSGVGGGVGTNVWAALTNDASGVSTNGHELTLGSGEGSGWSNALGSLWPDLEFVTRTAAVWTLPLQEFGESIDVPLEDVVFDWGADPAYDGLVDLLRGAALVMLCFAAVFMAFRIVGQAGGMA